MLQPRPRAVRAPRASTKMPRACRAVRHAQPVRTAQTARALTCCALRVPIVARRGRPRKRTAPPVPLVLRAPVARRALHLASRVRSQRVSARTSAWRVTPANTKPAAARRLAMRAHWDTIAWCERRRRPHVAPVNLHRRAARAPARHARLATTNRPAVRRLATSALPARSASLVQVRRRRVALAAIAGRLARRRKRIAPPVPLALRAPVARRAIRFALRARLRPAVARQHAPSAPPERSKTRTDRWRAKRAQKAITAPRARRLRCPAAAVPTRT